MEEQSAINRFLENVLFIQIDIFVYPRAVKGLYGREPLACRKCYHYTESVGFEGGSTSIHF